MPIDLFEKHGIDPNSDQQDLFNGLRNAPKPMPTYKEPTLINKFFGGNIPDVRDPNVLRQVMTPPAGQEAENIFGMATGVLGGPASAGIKAGANQLLGHIQPQKYVNALLNHLGQGAKTSEEIGQSLAKDIRGAYRNVTNKAESYFKPAQERFGNENIFPESKNPLGQTVQGTPKFEESHFPASVKRVVKEFNNSPTLNNAHDLQSQLGVEIGKLSKIQRTPDVENSIEHLKEVRDGLNNHITGFLEKKDKNIADLWNQGKEFFKEHIVPYRSDKGLLNVARGKVQNPKNIHSLFEFPEGTVNEAGKLETTQNINKILEHLPEESKNKILFSKIQGYGKLKPEQVANKLNEALEGGYSKYFTPEVQNMLNNLPSKIRNANMGKFIGKSAAGGAAAIVPGAYVVNKLFGGGH